MEYEKNKSEIDYIFEERARYGNYEVRTKLQDIDIAGDHITGALLSRLVYWDERASIVRDGYKWVAKTIDTLYEEIRITREQYLRSIKILVSKGVVIKDQFMFNGLRTNHFRIDRIIYQKLMREVTTGSSEKPLPTESGKPTVGSSETLRPITKNTTNNTQIKRVAKAPRLNFSESHMNIAKTMQRKIKDINPNFAAKDIEAWANEIRLMTDRDKRQETEIVDLFNWANDHSFWRANILSPKKLRKQWDILMTQKLAEKDKGKNEDEDWFYNWQSGNSV